jgi:hypothetical protein
MYLMFEALGRVSDRELMLVNLNLLDTQSASLFPPKRLDFVLYNPTAQTRTASIAIPPAQRRPVRFSRDAKPVDDTLQIPGHTWLRLLAEY